MTIFSAATLAMTSCMAMMATTPSTVVLVKISSMVMSEQTRLTAMMATTFLSVDLAMISLLAASAMTLTSSTWAMALTQLMTEQAYLVVAMMPSN